MDSSNLPTRFHRKRVESFAKKVGNANRQLDRAAVLATAAPGFLLKDEGEMVTQSDLVNEVDIGSATKRFDIKLTGGPFSIDYSKNGRFLAYCGKNGSIAAFDWLTKSLLFESMVDGPCKDIKFLHQETFIAVAESRSTSIYDNQGVEIHCIKKLGGILRLEFLPYHFLLVASAANGYLYYLDCSTGAIIASCPTYMGRLGLMCQNPANAVILTGHNTGAVSMWIPSEKSPVVKLLTHHCALSAIACDRTGCHLATAGLDRKLKVWDIRSTYDPLVEINLPVSASYLDFSQRGLLALSAGSTVQILKDTATGAVAPLDPTLVHEPVATGVNRRVLSSAYLTHYAARPVHRVRFCPYEDVLGIGTAGGVSSLLCPGSAEANYDALEENPFANRRYRQEREIKRLLDKIPYTMISLDSVIDKVRREDIVDEWEKKKAAMLGETDKKPVVTVRRNKRKGRSKPSRVEANKQSLRFERTMFTLKSALGLKLEKQRAKQRRREAKEADMKHRNPSDTLVSRKPLSKKRSKSALDVLIPPQE